MSQKIELVCSECKVLTTAKEVLFDGEEILTIEVASCPICAYGAGHKAGYKLGYSTGFLACERGEKFR